MKFIRTPFANNGDKDPVPQTDPSGNVNWDQGYPISYSKDPAVDPTAKRIERGMYNEVLNFITSGLREIQTTGVSPFIPTADNGGVAYPYGMGAIVNYNNVPYISLKTNNTSLPTVVADWSPLASNAFVQDMIGNFSDTTLLTTSQTLIADQSGMVFGIGTAGISITVPDLTLVPNGASYTFKNLANGRATILPPAGGSFYISDQTVTSLILNSGDSVTLVGAATVYGALISRVDGNLSGTKVVATSSTLLPSDAGRAIVVNATGLTITLPLANTMVSGATLIIQPNENTTLAVSGGNQINLGGPSLLTTLTLNKGDIIHLYCDGNNLWNGVSGAGQLRDASVFTALKATNGYQKLPSGLIIQWGSVAVTVPTAGTTVTQPFTFPIAFPNAALWVGAPCLQTSSPELFSSSISLLTLTGATAYLRRTAGTGLTGMFWLSIGY